MRESKRAQVTATVNARFFRKQEEDARSRGRHDLADRDAEIAAAYETDADFYAITGDDEYE